MIGTTPIAAARPGAPQRPTLYYIRHGETDWNREGRLQGAQDIPLNDLGRKQATMVGQHLRDLIGGRAETLPWHVSPMDRARETLALARRTIGLPKDGYTIDPRLAELSFGTWEGLTWKDVRKSDPARAAGRDADKWGYVPPGGESYAMLRERVMPFFNSLTGEAVVVAHGGIARTLLVELAGMDTLEATVVDIWQGRVLVFEAGGAHWAP